MANHHVVGLNPQHLRVPLGRFQGDSIAGSGLSGDCHVWAGDAQPSFQLDNAADSKHDRARTLRRKGRPQAPGTAVVQIDDGDHTAAAAANRPSAVTLGAGKRWERRLCLR